MFFLTRSARSLVMGNSFTIDSKGIIQYGHADFRTSVVTMHGGRSDMEDTVSVTIDHVAKNGKHYSFFAVFDGHGGGEISEFLETNMAKALKALSDPTDEKAIIQCFLVLDELVRDTIPGGGHGSTVALAIYDHADRCLTTAHAGDSRIVVYHKGCNKWTSTTDHKPDHGDEKL